MEIGRSIARELVAVVFGDEAALSAIVGHERFAELVADHDLALEVIVELTHIADVLVGTTCARTGESREVALHRLWQAWDRVDPGADHAR